jgi:hypothetical protein
VNLLGVEAGANRSAADGKLIEAGPTRLDVGEGGADLPRPAVPFLANGEGNSVFEMCPSDLDHARPAVRLALDCLAQRSDLRQQLFVKRVHRRDMHRGREGIVGRLTHIDVVVRAYRMLRAELAA